MDTRENIEDELIARLQTADNSTLFPASRITQLIQRAYVWATQLFIWQDLVKGKYTTTQANINYYDYPESFRTSTIIRLEVDGESYDRVNFEDFLAYKENNPTGEDKIFANYGRQVFISPTPTSAGLNLSVWGAYNVKASDLSSSSSQTIFSENKEEGNEAIVKKAYSVAIKGDNNNLAISEEKDALGILARLHQEEQASTQRDKRKDHPKFDVHDMFRGSNTANLTGHFSYRP